MFPPERLGLAHQARISASVNAMRILNTGTEVEAAVADALLLGDARNNKVEVYLVTCDLDSLSSLPSES